MVAFPACFCCCSAIIWGTSSISFERLIEQNKERYYETLEQSSQGWHKGKHDPWPFINYLLSILKTAYQEFAERVGDVKAPRGAKTGQVLNAINSFSNCFTVTQLELSCPGISRDMIRRVLKEQQHAGKITCKGRGRRHDGTRKGNYLLVRVIIRVITNLSRFHRPPHLRRLRQWCQT